MFDSCHIIESKYSKCNIKVKIHEGVYVDEGFDRRYKEPMVKLQINLSLSKL